MAALQVPRTEMRAARTAARRPRRFDHLLVGVEAGERVVVVHGDLSLELLLERLAAVLQLVGERIGHGHQQRILVGADGVDRRAGAAAAAADEADLEHVAAGGMHRRAAKLAASGPPTMAPCGAVQELAAVLARRRIRFRHDQTPCSRVRTDSQAATIIAAEASGQQSAVG